MTEEIIIPPDSVFISHGYLLPGGAKVHLQVLPSVSPLSDSRTLTAQTVHWFPYNNSVSIAANGDEDQGVDHSTVRYRRQ